MSDTMMEAYPREAQAKIREVARSLEIIAKRGGLGMDPGVLACSMLLNEVLAQRPEPPTERDPVYASNADLDKLMTHGSAKVEMFFWPVRFPERYTKLYRGTSLSEHPRPVAEFTQADIDEGYGAFVNGRMGGKKQMEALRAAIEAANQSLRDRLAAKRAASPVEPPTTVTPKELAERVKRGENWTVEPPKQEPVAWCQIENGRCVGLSNTQCFGNNTPLYASPVREQPHTATGYKTLPVDQPAVTMDEDGECKP